MLALVILALLLGYLAIAITATVGVVYLARSGGLSRRSRWLAGAFVAIAFYLIPFWDWIPTVMAHSYYCGKDAKFVIHKTVDQWKKENAEVVPSLHYDPRARFTNVGEYERFPLNQRIASEHRITPVFLSIRREEGRVIDMKTGDVLALFTDFRAGYPPLAVGGEGSWKFWLKRNDCGETARTPGTAFWTYTSEWSRAIGEKR